MEKPLSTLQRARLLTVHTGRRPGQVTDLEVCAEAAHLDVRRLHLESEPGAGMSTIRLELSGLGAEGRLVHFAE